VTTIRAILISAVLVTVTTAAMAGTMFRLEIGLPIAAGIDSKTKNVKNAVLVVRPVVCDDVAGVHITGMAEGVVNGARQSVAVRLIPVTPGVFAVARQWPEGQWVLHLAGTCPTPKAAASTIVPLAGTSFIREKTQVLREPATRAQIEAALSDLVRSQS
jgi:hypothetical protein